MIWRDSSKVEPTRAIFPSESRLRPLRSIARSCSRWSELTSANGLTPGRNQVGGCAGGRVAAAAVEGCGRGASHRRREILERARIADVRAAQLGAQFVSQPFRLHLELGREEIETGPYPVCPAKRIGIVA